MSSSSSTAPVSSQTSKKSSRAIIGMTIALVTCAILFTALFILYTIRQYRRRMSRLGGRRDASAVAVDLEAAETRSDYSFFDDEKKGISATPSIISIPDTVYAPHSGPVPITHEQRMKEVDLFFGGAPLHRSQ